MAVVVTTFTPNPQPFAFTTAPGDLINRTALPRAEIIHAVSAGEIVAAGVGDSQLLNVRIELPQNYTYVCVDVALAITGVDAGDWNANALFTIGRGDFQQWMSLESPGVTVYGTGAASQIARAYKVPARLPKGLVLGAPTGSNSTINVENGNLNGTAMEVRFYSRFLQYDIDQFHHVEVNTPSLTR